MTDDCVTTATVIRETGREVFGASSGQRTDDKETWWWNEKIQESIQRKGLEQRTVDRNISRSNERRRRRW